MIDQVLAELKETLGNQGMSDERAMGVLTARHFKWDAFAIIRTTHAALVDANFHTEAEQLRTGEWAEAFEEVAVG